MPDEMMFVPIAALTRNAEAGAPVFVKQRTDIKGTVLWGQRAYFSTGRRGPVLVIPTVSGLEIALTKEMLEDIFAQVPAQESNQQ
jgi:hypothetical protein